jgi:hypothetical protein
MKIERKDEEKENVESKGREMAVRQILAIAPSIKYSTHHPLNNIFYDSNNMPTY